MHPILDIVMLLHSFFTIFPLMTGAGFLGLLVFSSEQHRGAVNTLKILAFVTTIFVFALNITGAYGYVYYRLPDPQSAKSIILKESPFAHQILFTTKEYLALVGPVWATMITWLTWHFKERIFTNPAVKKMMLVLIVVAVLYALVIAYGGIVPTRIAAVR